MNKRGCLYSLFGVGALLLVCAVIFAFNARQIALWAAGFEGGGDTTEVLGDIAAEPQPDPLISYREDGTLGGGDRLDTVTVAVNGQTTTIDVAAVGAESAAQVETDTGESAIVITYNESDLNDMLVQAVLSEAPAGTEQQVRNVAVDLKEGAAVISAEANLGFIWQPFSVVLTFDNVTKQLDVAGLDINGSFFESPPAGMIGDQLNALEAQANQALAQTALVGPNGETLTIDQVSITENGMEILAR